MSIPCADEILVLVRVVVEHKGGNPERNSVLYELVYTVSHVRRRLIGHHGADLSSALAESLIILRGYVGIDEAHLVYIEHAQVEKLDELVELHRQERGLVLAQQRDAEREHRFDAARQAVVVYSEDDVHRESVPDDHCGEHCGAHEGIEENAHR